jgi:hypothetical protein
MGFSDITASGKMATSSDTISKMAASLAQAMSPTNVATTTMC